MEFIAVRNETQIAALYGCWACEPILEVLSTFADDTLLRRNLYPSLTNELAGHLARLSAEGLEMAGWPRYEQRHEYYRRTLSADFFQGLATLFSRARRVTSSQLNATSAKRFSALIETFRMQVRAANDEILEGRLITLREMYEHVSSLLVDARLTTVLGAQDPNAVEHQEYSTSVYSLKLVELMSSRIIRGGQGHLPLSQLLLINQLAVSGAHALATILSSDQSYSSEAIVDWQEALDDLIPPVRIVNAWRDPRARSELNSLERSHIPPNPAGPISLPAFTEYLMGGGVTGTFDTLTEVIAVCCSTGCLPCSDVCAPTNFPVVCTGWGGGTCGLACGLASRFGASMGGGAYI
jgi:mersacidin/lichenicidin family type 2 lantibiotic